MMMGKRTLGIVVGLLLLAAPMAPASAQTWTASSASPRYDTTNTQTFTYDFTTVAHSPGIDTRECDAGLTAALEGSIGDTSADSRIRLHTCFAEQDGTAPDAADDFIGCAPASALKGEFAAAPIVSSRPFTRVEVVKAPTGGDTSRVTLTCQATGKLWNGSAWVDSGAARLGHGRFVICGEATTVNNNTVYYGPNLTLPGNGVGLTCNINAVGSTTEATVDEPVYTNQAVGVASMTCRNEGDADADVSFTLRTAEGATVPSVGCTIADGERDCVADVQTTTDIAAGATVAVAVASTGDIADNNGFVCRVETSF